MFAYSWFGDHRGYVYDDAGITLRYAERIARGAGFGYNLGESINGASNPLFVFLEAALLRAGWSPNSAVLAIASVSLGASAAVLFATFALFYSLWAACFSVLALLAFRIPFDNVTDGMETPLVGLLVVLLFRALHSGNAVFHGLALGALVANKLDGALAAVAFTAVHLVLRRSFPWRAALVALLAASPVFVVLLATFGSILPNSMLVKLSDNPPGLGVVDPWWMQQLLTRGGFALLYWAAWASLVVLAFARRAHASLAIATLQTWFVLHMVAYATIDLGDAYPWYAAAPTYQCVILATVLAHTVVERASISALARRLGGSPIWGLRKVTLVSAALFVALLAQRAPTLAARVFDRTHAEAVGEWTALDLSRQAAGAWLRVHTSGTEMLVTYEGLPAFEYGGPCYDEALLNSAPDNARLVAAPYSLVGPMKLAEGEALPWTQPGSDRTLVATFRFSATGSFHLLYAKPRSEVDRSGVRHLMFATPVLELVDSAGAALGPATRSGGAWRIPTQATARFEVDSPAAVRVLFTAAVSGSGLHDAVGEDSVRIRILCSGVEIDALELHRGDAPTPMAFDAVAADLDGRVRIAIASERVGEGRAQGSWLEIRELLLRHGEPVRPKDFKLLHPRCVQRIDHVASVGLP